MRGLARAAMVLSQWLAVLALWLDEDGALFEMNKLRVRRKLRPDELDE